MAGTGAKGRTTHRAVLRDCFAESWRYVSNGKVFVHKDFLHIQLEEDAFNKYVRGLSHLEHTSKKLLEQYRGRINGFCYRPDLAARIVTNDGESAINAFTPTRIKSCAGDATLFLEYLSYLYPNPNECNEVKRWLATLIARPGTRMGTGCY